MSPLPNYAKQPDHELAATALQLRHDMGLLTEAEVGAMLDASEHTLQGWRVQGTGPRYAKLGKSIFYTVAELLAWVEGNTRKSTTKELAEV
jgi:predicted DNA-binding transcriptional regulator AlpA